MIPGQRPLSIALCLCVFAASGAAASTAEDPAALVARIQPAVEELRGLKFKRPVTVKTVTPAEARAHFSERARSEWPEERVRLDQKAYEQLGLLPAGFDLLASILDVLEEQALGYYDPGSDVFSVVEGAASSTVAPVLFAHELTHALDDQHFDLDALLESTQGEDDRSAAIAAVVEGSGTAVMTLFMVREIGAGRLSLESMHEMQRAEKTRAERLRTAPPVIQRGLIASYVLGMSFLFRGDARRMLLGIPSADFDRAFKDPPRTTEQILHAEKYWDEARRDAPSPLAPPDLSGQLGPDWTLAGRGTLGELVLAAMSGGGAVDFDSPEATSPAHWTNAAAAGTAGDVYQHYANGTKSATILTTRWETEKDAAEFQDGLRSVPRSRSYRSGNAVVVLGGDDLGGAAPGVAASALQTALQ
ncbi:MAG TPA: hypothetical protein VFM88_16075 [Vicinamibacteria bacterium]|nr:hypothetical protein [Vicinamibacteria bacterium]